LSSLPGIGLDRITANFRAAQIDLAVTVSDQQALDMAHYIQSMEGELGEPKLYSDLFHSSVT